MREFLKSNTGGRKLWGNILQKFGEGMREFPKNKIDGRNYGGFQKFGEGMRKFPRNTIGLLAGGNYGGIFSEIWRWYARISNTLLAGINYGGHCSRNLRKICANFQKNTQYWREETMG